MKIRKARNEDLVAVEELLAASKLPLDGVRDHFADFIVAEQNDGIEGAVGLEKYDSVALLRSAVVAPQFRGSGIGARLVEEILKRAEADGPERLKSSAEFQGACPDTAVVMKRRLARIGRPA